MLSELRESLQQQTATADVLKVISRSTFELQTVLDTLTGSAAKLCNAHMATILRQKGSAFFYATNYNFPPDFWEFIKSVPVNPGRGTCVGRVLLEGKTVHIHDAATDSEYTLIEAPRLGSYHTILGVPLLREGSPIGVIALMRVDVQPFTDKEIELVATFADQAVIAIENVRLFEAEQKRTDELTEALEQQTATSEVLQVISSSPGDLQPVFETMLANAVRICDAKFGNIYRWDGDAFDLVATHNTPPAFAEARRRSPIRPRPDNLLSRMVATKTVIHVADYERLAIEQGVPEYVTGVELGGVRTALFVPMLKDNELIGYFSVYRQEVRPFTARREVRGLADDAALADGGYAGGKMALTMWRTGVWRLQIVKRSDVAGFEVLPKRWIVERTFAWISRNRRLARDFERYAATAAAFVRLAMIRIMLRRLAANASS